MTSYLQYARNNDRIKGVVIALSSPGGGATSSERLYIETRRLRQEKPVIIIMNDLVASGGFMMSMGASHTFVKSSSLVGNVGVVSGLGPVLPELPPESVIFTGPSKLTKGGDVLWATPRRRSKDYVSPYQVEWNDIIAAIREDREPNSSLAQGLDAMLTLHRLNEVLEA